MNSIYNLIITTGNRYNNTIDVEGKELIVNTEVTEHDAQYVNRIGTVVGTPLAIDTPLRPGDEVIVHHNTFRRWYDIRGEERNGGAYIDEDLYTVALSQVYAYRKPGCSWKATPGYCFVTPIKEKDNDWSVSNERTHVGYIQYGSDQLELSKGSLVGFTPNSEYEFNIEGNIYYRIYLNDITWTSNKNVRELLSRPR